LVSGCWVVEVVEPGAVGAAPGIAVVVVVDEVDEVVIGESAPASAAA
jgi:hypothetical protein